MAVGPFSMAGEPHNRPIEACAPAPGPPRVLIVEDDPIEGRLMLEILAEFGYDPCLAVDAGQALARIEAGPGFRAALIDLHGVALDGKELARQIRRRGGAGGMTLVAVTGASPSALAGEPGLFDCIFHKPIDLDALLTLLAAEPSPGGGPLFPGEPGS